MYHNSPFQFNISIHQDFKSRKVEFISPEQIHLSAINQTALLKFAKKYTVQHITQSKFVTKRSGIKINLCQRERWKFGERKDLIRFKTYKLISQARWRWRYELFLHGCSCNVLTRLRWCDSWWINSVKSAWTFCLTLCKKNHPV